MRRYINIVENAQAPGEALFRQYGGKVYDFSNLPQAGKNAIIAYYEEEHGMTVPPDSKWGYVELPMDSLKQAIGGFGGEHADFDAYHVWYIDGGDIPNHAGPEYAVILSGDSDVIYDGWHRFHHYVRSGVEVVPAVLPLDQ